MILLITGSSTEPSLFHASCRPTLHVGLFHRLYLTLSQNGLPNTYIWSCRNQSYNNIRKEMPNTHIWPCGNTSHNPVKKAQHSHPFTQWLERPNTYTWPCEEPILHSKRRCTYIWQPMSERLSTYIRPCKEPILHAKMALHLHLITNVKRACTHIWSCRNQSYNHIRKAFLALTSDHVVT